ncbi:LysR family transcriptional regulator [Thaumasiovibrio sp. DFM-14]|uniref:LysR family transcriptional regulator n=1 Tax=Thaumasiovibrio sp. DFM-14 TaxID=3384792 RepID=UPI0039A32656
MTQQTSLPSIRSLQSFIVVARCQSFTRASKQLCLTQSAISKQIQSLEVQLGQALFYRHHAQLTLTDAGKKYLEKATQAISLLQHATAEMKQTPTKRIPVTLNVPPSFGSLWLVNAITSVDLPDIQLNIETANDPLIDSSATVTSADITIRCLPLGKHYQNATLLIKEELCFVASRRFFAHQPIHSLELARHYPWLKQLTRPSLWELFLQHHCIDAPDNYAPLGVEHFFLALSVIEQQALFALLPEFMIREQLKRDTLINPCQAKIDSGYGYYLFCDGYKRTLPSIHLLTQWLINALT